jgi:hypothetical protein
VCRGASGIGTFATRRITCNASTINAGPETKAETMKRGAKIAVFQNGRPPKPLNRNAVTV